MSNDTNLCIQIERSGLEFNNRSNSDCVIITRKNKFNEQSKQAQAEVSLVIQIDQRRADEYIEIQANVRIQQSPALLFTKAHVHLYQMLIRCLQNYYAGEEVKSRRSGAGIGYCSKSDFTKDLTCSPSSSRYHLKSQFESEIEKKKGVSIGLGREKVLQGSYINRELCRTPSSTKYKIDLNSSKNKAPIFTMRKKTKMINKTMTIEPQNDYPGPAQYLNPQNNTRSIHTSKFSTINYTVSKSQRFQKQQLRSPGPGVYNDVSSLSNVGKYIVSTSRGGTNAKFGTSKRVTRFDELTKRSNLVPGVGSYKTPSQFGQYDGDVY